MSNTLLAQLEDRLKELRQAEAQAIHTLGAVSGRIEELDMIIQALKAEPIIEVPPAAVEH